MQQHRRISGDAGTSVVELVVALFVVTIVMTSAAAFFINSLKNSGLQAQRQTAVVLTNQVLERVQALKPAVLLDGRAQAAVQTLLAPADALAATTEDVRTTGNFQVFPVAAQQAVPADTTAAVDGTTYRLRTFINLCNLDPTSRRCLPTASAGSFQVYRATVLTTWTPGGQLTCSGGCRFTASQLVDFQKDPRFNTNLSTPNITSAAPSPLATGISRLLTITGSGFVQGATVDIADGGGTLGAIASMSGTTITVPWTAGPTPGSYVLTVVNPDGGRDDDYSVTVSARPTVTSVSPATVVFGAGSTAVSVTGTGFQNGLTTTFQGGSVSITSVTPTLVRLVLTPDGSRSGPSAVTLTNPDGGPAVGSVSISTPFPTLTDLNPKTYARGTTATATITGTGFIGPVQVRISYGADFVDATATRVLSVTTATIQLQVPTFALNLPVTIRLINGDGRSATKTVNVVVT